MLVKETNLVWENNRKQIYTFLAFSNLVARVFRPFLAIYNRPMVHHIFLIC
jgi:hypothetical protein